MQIFLITKYDSKLRNSDILRPQIGQILRNFESQGGHEVSYKKKRVMNQLPSEIFVLWSVSFLIKLSCKKLPPSLVKCVFFASMYPRQVKLSNVHLRSWEGFATFFFHLENFRISRLL